MQNYEVQPFITGFQIEELFGLYSYSVRLPKDLSENERRLLIIYGDNGCGKTTIINIIHHLLSQHHAKGHRSFLARSRFRRFKLFFSDGKSIEIEKHQNNGIGSYDLRLAINGKIAKEVKVNSSLRDGEIAVRGEDIDDKEIDNLFLELFEQPLSVMTLTDNREFQSDKFDISDDDDDHLVHIVPNDFFSNNLRRMVRHKTGPVGHQVDLSIRRAEEWIRQQALAARSRNDESVADIYTQLIRTFGKVLDQEPESIGATAGELKLKVENLYKKTSDLSDLGFTTAIPRDDLIEAIAEVSNEHLPMVGKLLAPYFESLESRIEGLLPIASRLRIFSKIVNTFFRSKSFKMNAVRGIELISKNNEPISPQMLSSGEKHLLLMLCNILIGTSERSLFLIDEPELSLNVKWQRDLIDSLLNLSAGSSVQFIMATHSIELLSQHRACTMRLSS